MKKIITLSLIFISAIAFGQSRADSIIKRNDTLFIVTPKIADKKIDTVKFNRERKALKAQIKAIKGEKAMWVEKLREAQGRLKAYGKLED